MDKDTFTPVVQEMVPGERLVLRIKGRIYDARHIYRVRPNGSGAQVIMTGSYGGLVALMMDKSFRKDLKDELAAIKKAAEAKREGEPELKGGPTGEAESEANSS